MKRFRGAVAGLAVAAAFCGNAAANTDACRDIMGAPGWRTAGGPDTAYYLVDTANAYGADGIFLSGKTKECSVPQNKGNSTPVGTRNVDQCGLLTNLANNDAKLAEAHKLRKIMDARDSLDAAVDKIYTLQSRGKMGDPEGNAIRTKFEQARDCVAGLLNN